MNEIEILYYDDGFIIWFVPDPAEQFNNPYLAMGNTPVNGYDPNGELFLIDDLIVTGIAMVGGYVYSGITTKDWGWQSAKTGLIWGGTALLALNTGGLSYAPGAAAQFGGQFVASQVASSLLPSANIQVNDNLSVNVGVGLLYGTGTSGLGLGMNVSANYSTGNFNFGVGASSNGFSGGSVENQFSGGVTWTDPKKHHNSVTLGFTRFTGKDPQNNWLARYQRGDFSFSTTNDAWVGGDEARTAAGQIGIGDYSVGMNIYTTSPPAEEYRAGQGTSNWTSPIWGENGGGRKAYSSGSRVYAGFYLGIQANNHVTRMGVDAPWVQDFFQNGVHRNLVGSPYFNTTFGPPTGLFGQGLYYNPYSLY